MVMDSLHTYYKQQLEQKGDLNAFEQLVASSLFKTGYIQPSLLEKVIRSYEPDSSEAPIKSCLQKLKELFALLCLLQLKGQVKDFQRSFSEAFAQVQKNPLIPQLQVAQALLALIAEFSKVTRLHFEAKSFSSGAAPAAWNAYWPWATLPQPKLQADMGLAWGVLGYLQGDADLIAKALKLGNWQVHHTLDHNFRPLPGLFWQEGFASSTELAASNALFFKTLALFSGDPGMEQVAWKQLQLLPEQCTKKERSFIAYAAAVSAWLEGTAIAPQPQEITLRRQVCDPHVALLGQREKNTTVMCTGLGCNTGLGMYGVEDVAVVNYGPQLYPLGACSLFGLQKTLVMKPEELADVWTEQSETGFILKGNGRVASLCPGEANEQEGSATHSGIWFDFSQKYSCGELLVECLPYGLGKTDYLAFAFYIRADKCSLGNGLTLSPRSLDRYEGKVEDVIAFGKQGRLEIANVAHADRLQVIPLAGDGSFWSADFLLAYDLHVEPKPFSWRLHSSSVVLV